MAQRKETLYDRFNCDILTRIKRHKRRGILKAPKSSESHIADIHAALSHLYWCVQTDDSNRGEALGTIIFELVHYANEVEINFDQALYDANQVYERSVIVA